MRAWQRAALGEYPPSESVVRMSQKVERLIRESGIHPENHCPMEKAESADPQRRNSRQRHAVQQAIEQAGRPLLPPEILVLAQIAQPSLGIATVYRNLKILVDAGEAKTVDLPGEATRYESAHHGHHHHFHCSKCQQVFDFHGCPPNLDTLAPRGFSVARHELTLYGVCAGCNDAPS